MSGWNLFFVFVSLFLLLIMVSQLYFYRRALHWVENAHRRKAKRWLIHILFLVFNIPIVFILVVRPHSIAMPEWFKLALVYPFYIWQFSFFLVFLVFMIGHTVSAPVRISMWAVKKFGRKTVEPSAAEITEPASSDTTAAPHLDLPFDNRRRVFIRTGATALIGAAFVGSAYATYGRNEYTVEDVTIPIKGLPPQFEGFIIGMISDIHSSVFMTKDQMQMYARAVNDLRSDLIVVTGDFVNSLVEEVYPFAEAFSELKAPYGVFGVLGNHDYFTKQVDTVAKVVNDCGVRMLRNDFVILDKNGEKLCLLGVDDIGSYRRAEVMFDLVTKGIGSHMPKVLLCHRPYFFPQAASRQIDLTLSGHTHGGQIVFAKLGNEVLAPARFASPYMAGIYTIGDSKMYVNRGVGTVGIPMRLNCPPELTKIKLVRA